MNEQPIPVDLAQALAVLVDENLGDWTYDIREREGEGWEGPRVKRFSDACTVVERYAGELTGPAKAELERQKRLDDLERQRREIENEIALAGGGQ